MFKKTAILFLSVLFGSLSSKAMLDPIPNSIYDFKIQSLEGEEIDFASFRGKKIMIVNTASKCGFTPQYAELEELHQKYKNQLIIIGFPSNNFMRQEPGSNEDIATFCQKNYGVSFLMSEKISVKGKDMSPIYRWLTNKDYNGQRNSSVKWNFQKYLIDEDGNLIEIFGSKTKPMSPEIIKAIER